MIEKAKAFGRKKHAGQVRKYTGEPYHTHPEAVSEIVASIGGDATMIVGAILHDTIEDTPTTVEEIRQEFGDEIARIVVGLTDVSQKTDGTRRVRKAIDRAHLAKGDYKIHTIKLADCIHNSINVIQCDKNFAAVYLREKRDLIKVLVHGDPRLMKEMQNILDEYFKSEGKE